MKVTSPFLDKLLIVRTQDLLRSSICQLQPGSIGDAEGKGGVCRCAPDSTTLSPLLLSMVVFLILCQQYFSQFEDCISSPDQWQPKLWRSRKGELLLVCAPDSNHPCSPYFSPTLPLSTSANYIYWSTCQDFRGKTFFCLKSEFRRKEYSKIFSSSFFFWRMCNLCVKWLHSHKCYHQDWCRFSPKNRKGDRLQIAGKTSR